MFSIFNTSILGKEAKLFENQIRETLNDTFGAKNLRITYYTRKLLNEIFKDLISDSEKYIITYKYQCHCYSAYIGRTSQRLHIKKDQHVTNALRNQMTYGTNKPTKSQSAFGEHLLNNLECSKNYNNNSFFIVCKGRIKPSLMNKNLFINLICSNYWNFVTKFLFCCKILFLGKV